MISLLALEEGLEENPTPNRCMGTTGRLFRTSSEPLVLYRLNPDPGLVLYYYYYKSLSDLGLSSLKRAGVKNKGTTGNIQVSSTKSFKNESQDQTNSSEVL